MALADHVFNAGQVISVIDNKVEGLQMEVVELKVGSEPEVVAAVKLQAFEVQALTDHLKVELEEVSHRQESLELDLDNSHPRGSLHASPAPALVENFMARWYIKMMALSLLSVGRPMMVYADGSSTTMKGTLSIFDLGSSPTMPWRVVVPREEMELLVNYVNALCRP
ncbi:hypothetical protein BHM03_00044931 [Ensete ventricosum]|nr:hypothetical protein BHM03_00044931 [Ensete ventricosum]